VACPVPETDRPPEHDDMDKAASAAFHSATARGLASMSAANEENNHQEGAA